MPLGLESLELLDKQETHPRFDGRSLYGESFFPQRW